MLGTLPAFLRPAVANGLGSLKVFGIYDLPNLAQGEADRWKGSDKEEIYELTQKPLRDYVPDDNGTTADQIKASPGNSGTATRPTSGQSN
jgi:hypothetical protein